MYKRAVRYVESANFTGLCALACDNTKLLPALCPYYDKERDLWMIIGGSGDEIVVSNKKVLQQILDSGQIIKAEKVRWFHAMFNARS